MYMASAQMMVWSTECWVWFAEWIFGLCKGRYKAISGKHKKAKTILLSPAVLLLLHIVATLTFTPVTLRCKDQGRHIQGTKQPQQTPTIYTLVYNIQLK
jgi:hypothetical protein